MVSGAGTLALAAGTTTFTADAAVANIAVIGGTLALGSTLTYAGNFTETPSGVVALDGDVLALTGPAATLNGRIDGPGTLATSGTAAAGVVTLDGGGT